MISLCFILLSCSTFFGIIFCTDPKQEDLEIKDLNFTKIFSSESARENLKAQLHQDADYNAICGIFTSPKFSYSSGPKLKKVLKTNYSVWAIECIHRAGGIKFYLVPYQDRYFSLLPFEQELVLRSEFFKLQPLRIAASAA